MSAAEVESQKSVTGPGQDPGMVTTNVADPQMVKTEDTMIEITEKIPNTDKEVTVKIETVCATGIGMIDISLFIIINFHACHQRTK